MSGDSDEQIRRLMQAGQKIEAIKVCREATGVGLAEAKAYVEALERGETVSRPDVQDIEAELRQMIREGETIAAIKRYREAAGVGLREAKEHIDDLERDMGRR